jgi:hypothetical protein
MKLLYAIVFTASTAEGKRVPSKRTAGRIEFLTPWTRREYSDTIAGKSNVISNQTYEDEDDERKKRKSGQARGREKI